METRKQTTQKWAPSGRDIKSILESIELNRYEENGSDWWHNKQGAVKWLCHETYKWKAQIYSLTALGGTHCNVFKITRVINKKNPEHANWMGKPEQKHILNKVPENMKDFKYVAYITILNKLVVFKWAVPIGLGI